MKINVVKIGGAVVEDEAALALFLKAFAAMEGLNTLYSSTGDTAVAGRTDMGWLTQSIMDRLAALESAAVNG